MIKSLKPNLKRYKIKENKSYKNHYVYKTSGVWLRGLISFSRKRIIKEILQKWNGLRIQEETGSRIIFKSWTGDTDICGFDFYEI